MSCVKTKTVRTVGCVISRECEQCPRRAVCRGRTRSDGTSRRPARHIWPPWELFARKNMIHYVASDLIPDSSRYHQDIIDGNTTPIIAPSKAVAITQDVCLLAADGCLNSSCRRSRSHSSLVTFHGSSKPSSHSRLDLKKKLAKK